MRAIVILTSAALSACSEESAPPCPGSTAVCPGEASVEAGTAPYDGTTDFVALDEGDEVPLVFGAQGGFHIWQSARARGVRRACLFARRIVTTDGMALFDNGDGDCSELSPDDGHCTTTDAQPSFVCARDVRDREVFLEVTIDDGDVHLSDRVRVRVVCPEPGTDDGSGNDVGQICRSEGNIGGCPLL